MQERTQASRLDSLLWLPWSLLLSCHCSCYSSQPFYHCVHFYFQQSPIHESLRTRCCSSTSVGTCPPQGSIFVVMLWWNDLHHITRRLLYLLIGWKSVVHVMFLFCFFPPESKVPERPQLLLSAESFIEAAENVRRTLCSDLFWIKKSLTAALRRSGLI